MGAQCAHVTLSHVEKMVMIFIGLLVHSSLSVFNLFTNLSCETYTLCALSCSRVKETAPVDFSTVSPCRG